MAAKWPTKLIPPQRSQKAKLSKRGAKTGVRGNTVKLWSAGMSESRPSIISHLLCRHSTPGRAKGCGRRSSSHEIPGTGEGYFREDEASGSERNQTVG